MRDKTKHRHHREYPENVFKILFPNLEYNSVCGDTLLDYIQKNFSDNTRLLFEMRYMCGFRWDDFRKYRSINPNRAQKDVEFTMDVLKLNRYNIISQVNFPHILHLGLPRKILRELYKHGYFTIADIYGAPPSILKRILRPQELSVLTEKMENISNRRRHKPHDDENEIDV